MKNMTRGVLGLVLFVLGFQVVPPACTTEGPRCEGPGDDDDIDTSSGTTPGELPDWAVGTTAVVASR